MVQSSTMESFSTQPLAFFQEHGLLSGPKNNRIQDSTVIWLPNAATIRATLAQVGMVNNRADWLRQEADDAGDCRSAVVSQELPDLAFRGRSSGQRLQRPAPIRLARNAVTGGDAYSSGA